MFFKDLKSAVVESWTEGWEIGKTKRPNYIPPPEPIDESITEEIETLKIIIKRQYEIGKLLEDELTRTRAPNKRTILLNKLNTLDNQTLKNVKRLKYLEDNY